METQSSLDLVFHAITDTLDGYEGDANGLSWDKSLAGRVRGAGQGYAKPHNVKPDHIATWAGRKGLFDDLTFLREGVFAWYDGDFTKAVHVLVPQVERGLRGIGSSLGKPISKPHPTVKGAGVAINMGDILYSKDITELLGADLTLHLLALYLIQEGSICAIN